MQRFVLENVVRRYREARTGRPVEALRVPLLELTPGEIVAVVGPNGSGKSTLLETMAFLHRPDEGRVLLDGVDVWASGRALTARRRCPILLQRTVLFRATVLRNVVYPLRLRGIARNEALRRARAVLELAGLGHLAHRGHRELSGGERQRAALARLLALEPEVLLLDEPTAHVDRANEELIEGIIRELHGRTGMTVVLASHNPRQAGSLADRTVALVDGRLLPGGMENILSGTLAAENGHLLFRGEREMALRFPPESLAREDRGVCPATPTPAEIALATGGWEILSAADESPMDLPGTVQSVLGRPDRCRLEVRLADGQAIQAELPEARYRQLGLNLGSPVRLRPGKEAVRVVKLGAEEAP